MNRIGKYTVNELENGELLVAGESINDKALGVPVGELLTINGAWYLDSLPNQIIAELEDGSLTKFRITPFRKITDKDFTPYKSYHPRKSKGQPLPDYLYRFYGLQKNDESATEVIHTRLTPAEKVKIETYAANQVPKKTVSEVIRDFIRGL